jgi:tetratricopeptide (TPR) repeat protein
MHPVEKILNNIKFLILNIVLVLIPLCILPVTRDFVILSKFYLLFYGVIALLVITLIHLITTKSLSWSATPFSQSLLVIASAYILSTLIMSPNKFQALFAPHVGALTVIGLILFYISFVNYIKHHHKYNVAFPLVLSGFLTGLVALILIIEPFKNVTLSADLAFLKNPSFNTVGSQIEFLLFEILVLIVAGTQIWNMKKQIDHESKEKEFFIVYIILSLFIVLAVGFQLYQIIKTVMQGTPIVFPPLNLSWYAAVEVLKNPLTAIFGIGVDNFMSIYTRVRDISYNSTSLWQVTWFSTSRSTLLHVLTETGILGLIGFLFLFAKLFQNFKRVDTSSIAIAVYGLVCLVFFPPSFITFFIFFVSLILFTRDLEVKHPQHVYKADFNNILPVYIGIIIIFGLALVAGLFYGTKPLIAELYFNNAVKGLRNNNLQEMYQNQRAGVAMNPYSEDGHISFSQVNLLVANSLASKKKEELSQTEKNTIMEAVQAAILEGKAAVSLNENKVSNWQNLTTIYSNIINLAQNAEVWTVASYQRMIAVDPSNPIHRLNLGGIFYVYGNYENAQRLFEQAISLKPDWANAHYNMAWTLYQKKDYVGAANEMQTVLTLLDPNKEQADYKKAQADLKEFMKHIPAEGQQNQEAVNPAGKNLNLPTPPVSTLEPKLRLPNESSPSGETGE